MTDAGTPPRKTGRPRKFGQGRIKAAVRVTPETHRQLKEAAEKNGRSVSEEIENRVERSFYFADYVEVINFRMSDVHAAITQRFAEIEKKFAEIGEKQERVLSSIRKEVREGREITEVEAELIERTLRAEYVGEVQKIAKESGVEMEIKGEDKGEDK